MPRVEPYPAYKALQEHLEAMSIPHNRIDRVMQYITFLYDNFDHYIFHNKLTEQTIFIKKRR